MKFLNIVKKIIDSFLKVPKIMLLKSSDDEDVEEEIIVKKRPKEKY